MTVQPRQRPVPVVRLVHRVQQQQRVRQRQQQDGRRRRPHPPAAGRGGGVATRRPAAARPRAPGRAAAGWCTGRSARRPGRLGRNRAGRTPPAARRPAPAATGHSRPSETQQQQGQPQSGVQVARDVVDEAAAGVFKLRPRQVLDMVRLIAEVLLGTCGCPAPRRGRPSKKARAAPPTPKRPKPWPQAACPFPDQGRGEKRRQGQGQQDQGQVVLGGGGEAGEEAGEQGGAEGLRDPRAPAARPRARTASPQNVAGTSTVSQCECWAWSGMTARISAASRPARRPHSRVPRAVRRPDRPDAHRHGQPPADQILVRPLRVLCGIVRDGQASAAEQIDQGVGEVHQRKAAGSRSCRSAAAAPPGAGSCAIAAAGPRSRPGDTRNSASPTAAPSPVPRRAGPARAAARPAGAGWGGAVGPLAVNWRQDGGIPARKPLLRRPAGFPRPRNGRGGGASPERGLYAASSARRASSFSRRWARSGGVLLGSSATTSGAARETKLGLFRRPCTPANSLSSLAISWVSRADSRGRVDAFQQLAGREIERRAGHAGRHVLARRSAGRRTIWTSPRRARADEGR